MNPRSTGPASGERFVEFDQNEFLPNPTSPGMANTGWLYVPSNCANGQACRLHVAFHGCRRYPSYQYFVLGQGMVTYGTTFVKNSGYNGWADTNNIIVLYPQTTSSFVPANPLGCWDWWGYDDAAYVTRNGRQMKAVKAMVDRITQGAVALAAPTGLRVTANGDSSLSLAWDAVAGAAGYAVYRDGTKIGGAAGETHADNGLASGTEYRYAVSALAPSGAEGRPSSELLGKTTGSPPVVAPPTNLAAGAVTPNSVGLSWAAAAGAAGYDIFRGTGTGAPVRINPTRVPVTSYTAEGLTPSTTYSFTVKAYDTAGAASAPSNTVTIVTGALAACFMASNFAHVQAGRAHDRGGIAFANGSDERMGLNNLFFTTTLKQTGSNFYVIDNLTCP